VDEEELIRGAFAASFGLEGIDAWLAFADQWWAEDIEMTEDPLWPGAGTFEGRRAVAERFVEYIELFRDGSVSVDAVHQNDRLFVVELCFHVRGAGSGVEVEQAWAWLMLVDEGRTKSIRPYRVVDEAFAAAGIDRPT
jgi:ketosteroid isomerase-like protein